MHIPRAPIPKYSGIDSEHMENNITLVTAYFHIDTFLKGNIRRGMEDYLAWTEGYSKLENDLIAFTDSPDVENMLWKARSHLPIHKTKIYLVNKNDMWAFSLSGKIKKIFAQPGYPEHRPNTVIEQYPCAMHAKYELIEKVIRERMFRTKYLAWIDIGYFRIRYRKSFQLLIPPDFQDDHIAFVQMNTFKPHTAYSVISNDAVWVAGGMFIGRPEYLMVFIEDYRRVVESLIIMNLMGTDQNLLYIMYTKSERVFPRVPLQTYSAPCKCDWFYLGRYCRHVYEMSRTERQRRLIGRGKLLSIYHQYM
ncbi:uncharacterized protein LOC117341791 [Pecten maximus]|uniref:uncharacterized protein LOC117341791 n=1 Tax=Pecten maximus TaxID=6579 RepID=UPI001457FF25|nr:uncharacterized protein LOC117341791 [Pecten maximus]